MLQRASSTALGVHQRPGSVEGLAGLEERLEAGEDHRPAAVELGVGLVRQPVVDDGQPARAADRHDLPGHPGGALGLDLVAPQRVKGLHEQARWVDLDVGARGDVDDTGHGGGVVGARGPVALRLHAEAVDRALGGVGDRLPQSLRRGLDVDLEHGGAGGDGGGALGPGNSLDAGHVLILQIGLEPAERGRPGLGVLAHPPVVDEPDGDGVEEVQLLAALAAGGHDPGLLEHLQVLHHAEARHRQAPLECREGLAVLPEELVEQGPAGRVGQCLEHLVHDPTIGDHSVTCQEVARLPGPTARRRSRGWRAGRG